MAGTLGRLALELGISNKELIGGLAAADAKIVDTERKSSSSMSGIAKSVAAVGAATGLALLAHSAVDAATTFQATTSQIASQAGIAESAADGIGNAFLASGGKSTFSAQQMETAYAGVAGQLGVLYGHALSAREALDFVTHASDLARASGASLDDSTQALTATMKAFHLGAGDAGMATDVLYQTSRRTGIPINDLAQGIAKLDTKLGPTAGSLKDVATQIALVNSQGVSGSRAIMQVTASWNNLANGAAAADKAVAGSSKSAALQAAQLKNARDSVVTADAAYQKLVESGHASALALDKASVAADSAHARLANLTAGVGDKLNPVQLALAKLGVSVYDGSGKFAGMGKIMQDLAPKLATMGEEQRKAYEKQLFGNDILDGTIVGLGKGTISYAQFTNELTKSNSAHDVAADKAKTLEGSLQKLHATGDDLKIQVGSALVPAINGLATAATPVLTTIAAWAGANPTLTATLLGVVVAIAAVVAIVKVASTVGTAFSAVGDLIGKTHVIGAARTAAAWAATAARSAAGFAMMAARAVAAGAIATASFLASAAEALGLAAAQGAVAAATGAWTAAQWLLNVAMDANPIGLVVLAVAALIGGVILAYQHIKPFRDIVNAAWREIGVLWEKVGGLNGIIGGLINVGKILLTIALTPMRLEFAALTAVISFLWDNFKGFAGFLGGAFKTVLNAISGPLKAIGGAIKGALDPNHKQSPSLVENVTSGVAIIASKYKSLSGLRIGGPSIGGVDAGSGHGRRGPADDAPGAGPAPRRRGWDGSSPLIGTFIAQGNNLDANEVAQQVAWKVRTA